MVIPIAALCSLTLNYLKRSFFYVFVSAVLALSVSYVQNAQSQTRNIRTQRLVLDDGTIHTLTLQSAGLGGVDKSYTFPVPGAGLFQSDASGVISITAPSTGGNILMSNGSVWQSVAQSNITSVGTITAGLWHGTTIEAGYGGTGLASYTIGDILYASGTSALSKLAVGTTNQVLGTSAGVPAWTNNGATITNTTATPTALSASTDNYVIGASQTYIRLNNSSGHSIDLTGIDNTGVADGRNITLVNLGSDAIVIKHHGTSTPGNQFDLPGASDIILAQQGKVTFIYDNASGFWELQSTN